MTAGLIEYGGLLNRAAYFSESGKFRHVAHAAPEFLFRAGASRTQDPGDYQGGKEGKYVTHKCSLLACNLAKPGGL
jgi:hypothetical protein